MELDDDTKGRNENADGWDRLVGDGLRKVWDRKQEGGGNINEI